ncbi:MAG: hypothetical protein ACRCUP_01810 [Mycoplasmatales bacterium]
MKNIKEDKMKKLVLIAIIATFLSGINATRLIAAEKSSQRDVYYCREYWGVTSRTKTGISYDSWRNGPEINGTGSLSFSNTKGYNRSVSASASGSVQVGNSTLTTGLGFTIGRSFDISTSYSITGEKGKKKRIQYREIKDVYTIKQRKYRYCNQGAVTTPLNSYATAYVYKPYGWSYQWIYIR